MDKLPTYPAPSGGKLSAEMIADFRDAGVLILEGFVSPERCAALREHTLELITQFDPAEVKHVFSAIDDLEHGDAHLGGPNHSERSRHAYTLHVIEKNSRYPAENWLQRGAHLPMRGFTK